MNPSDHNEPCDLRQRKLRTSDSSNKCSDNSKLSHFDTGPALNFTRITPESHHQGHVVTNESQQHCETGLNSQQAKSQQFEQSKTDDEQPINKHAKCDALVIITVIISAILIKLMIDYLF